MAGTYGISAYQQTGGTWNTSKVATKTEQSSQTDKASAETKSNGVRISDFKPIETTSSLIPKKKDGLGFVIGDVELSDDAKKYYEKLKAKFHSMEFIAVSKDLKSQVRANAAAYGNANKQVVLIDDEKLEKMATDESFRKKYEGIIAMGQLKLQEAKNSLASSGANVKNFGISVDANGKTSFFATVEKAAEKSAAKKAADKKVAAKKEAKVKEKKLADKKAAEKKAAEKKSEEKAAKEAAEEAVEEGANVNTEEISNEPIDDKDYVEIDAPTMESLINQVSRYAYDNSARNVITDGEKQLGQNFDFRG